MSEDCREELTNDLAMWAQTLGANAREAKNDIYLLLDKYEVTSRCTEVAEIQHDRNEMLIKKFLIAKQVQGRTAKTVEFYYREVKKILDDIGKTVDDITPDDLRFYMAKRLRIDKISKVTIGNEMRCLSSFMGWLHAQEMIAKNPMNKVDKIKAEKNKKEAFTDMEIEKLRMAAVDERERAIIEMLLSTGCRVSELINIKDTEIEGNRILIHGKGEKDRYVYLNARAQLALQEYMKKRQDKNIYIFPKGFNATDFAKKNNSIPHSDWWKYRKNVQKAGHITNGTIEQLTRRIAKRAGVKKANPHKFRRTCATMALRKGMPLEQVSKMLGHEEISTTQIYLDLTEEELELAHKKYVV